MIAVKLETALSLSLHLNLGVDVHLSQVDFEILKLGQQ